MIIREHAIDPRLAPYVRLLWSLDDAAGGDPGGRAPERIVPDGIVEAGSRRARVALLQRFLLDRLDRHGRADVSWLVRAIWARRGRMRIGALARFLHSCALLRTGGTRSLAELALCAGFYDQPHFNRDFRRFADMTPREYLGHERVAALTIE